MRPMRPFHEPLSQFEYEIPYIEFKLSSRFCNRAINLPRVLAAKPDGFRGILRDKQVTQILHYHIGVVISQKKSLKRIYQIINRTFLACNDNLEINNKSL